MNPTPVTNLDQNAVKVSAPVLNIFAYSDYRHFLSDYYKTKKAQSTKFSYRYFAMKAGFSSASYLKLVMDGKRNLTECSQEKFVNAIGLSEKESEYFNSLVGLSQSHTEREKMKFFKRCELLKEMNAWELDKSSDVHMSPEIKKWLEMGKVIAEQLSAGKSEQYLGHQDILKGLIDQGLMKKH